MPERYTAASASEQIEQHITRRASLGLEQHTAPLRTAWDANIERAAPAFVRIDPETNQVVVIDPDIRDGSASPDRWASRFRDGLPPPDPPPPPLTEEDLKAGIDDIYDPRRATLARPLARRERLKRAASSLMPQHLLDGGAPPPPAPFRAEPVYSTLDPAQQYQQYRQDQQIQARSRQLTQLQPPGYFEQPPQPEVYQPPPPSSYQQLQPQPQPGETMGMSSSQKRRERRKKERGRPSPAPYPLTQDQQAVPQQTQPIIPDVFSPLPHVPPGPAPFPHQLEQPLPPPEPSQPLPAPGPTPGYEPRSRTCGAVFRFPIEDPAGQVLLVEFPCPLTPYPHPGQPHLVQLLTSLPEADQVRVGASEAFLGWFAPGE